MPQALPYFQAIGTFLFSRGTDRFVSSLIKTVLVNVVLGSLRFRDENGTEWVVDEDG